MKRNIFLTMLVMILAFGMTVIGCATVTVEEIEQGTHFGRSHYGFINPSIPFEEHCIVMNKCYDSYGSITGDWNKATKMPDTLNYQTWYSVNYVANGQSHFIGFDGFIILPPGKYSFVVAGQIRSTDNAIVVSVSEQVMLQNRGQLPNCSEDLSAGGIYQISATPHVIKADNKTMRLNRVDASITKKVGTIKDSADNPVFIAGKEFTWGSVIRGIKASIERTKNQ
jgi:hypothetical protein